MAEFVETNIQATISEVEEIERIGLLNQKEIKALIQKRREWEYRLARRSKSKDDYLNSIDYEKKLLELLRIRRRQIRIYEKYREIEGAISLRVMKRCRFMTRYWPGHLDTWALRLSFAIALGWKAEASIAYAEQVRYHGNKESVYISWARFEIEERGNFEVARKILLSKAPLYHQKSRLIKRELFRLELLYVESLKNRIEEDKAITEVIEENREKVLKCDIPRAVYLDSVKVIADPQLYLDFYQVANKYSFAHDLREEIYRDLVTAFPNSECLWKLKAQRTALGIEPINKEGEEEALLKLLAIDKLNSSIAVFDEAVEAIGPSFVVSFIEELMWMLYESWSNKELMKVIQEKIVSLCQSYSSVLLPVHYFIWHQILVTKSETSSALQTVLKDALKAYPEATPLQLEYFKQMLKDATDEEKLKEFNKVADSVKGTFGLQLWEEVANSIEDDQLKRKLFERASNHPNDTVAKGMRVRFVEWMSAHKGLPLTRKIYKNFAMRPPFSAKLHATMVMFELKPKKSKKQLDVENVRKIFTNALLHHGKTHPGVWLSYIHFEKLLGDPLKAGGLYSRAEKELEAKEAETFRQLNLTIEDLQSKKKESSGTSSNKEVWVTGNESEEECVEHTPAVVSLFEEELMLTYSVDQERKSFFSRINNMKNLLEKGNNEAPKESGREWEGVLEHLLHQKVPLVIQRVMVSNAKEKNLEISIEKRGSKNVYELSDHLDPGKDENNSKKATDGIEKILESSLTLKPEFMKQTQLEPYYVGKKKAKSIRMKERNKTKGPGWFDMKAPELTEEVKRDLEILKMRPILDPKRPFKNKDMQVIPKYFQMGKIMDSPAEFYSSRIPKKNRKRTMAEEILHDEEALRYQKRKYSEIVTKQQRLQPKRFSDSGKKNKKSKSQMS